MMVRYKEILREMGLSGKEVSELLGMNYDSYRSMTRSSARGVPRFVVVWVRVYEIMRVMLDDGSEKKSRDSQASNDS